MTISTELTTCFCSTCGVPFAVPEHLLATQRKHNDATWCPNGHPTYYKLARAAKASIATRRAKVLAAHVREQSEAREAAGRGA